MSNKDERLWKVGLVGTFVNFNFTEHSEEYFGFGIPVEFSKRGLSFGIQPFVLMIDNRLTLHPYYLAFAVDGGNNMLIVPSMVGVLADHS